MNRGATDVTTLPDARRGRATWFYHARAEKVPSSTNFLIDYSPLCRVTVRRTSRTDDSSDEERIRSV
ncbi:MAG: hypothetical protein C0483_03150 [Pirellula sp.]|nr:hypothetical protein [Pirellula sp.]